MFDRIKSDLHIRSLSDRKSLLAPSVIKVGSLSLLVIIKALSLYKLGDADNGIVKYKLFSFQTWLL